MKIELFVLVGVRRQKIQIRKYDHQGMMGAYISEAQALPKEKYGATVGWKTLTPLTWDQTKIEPASTGCRMIVNPVVPEVMTC